MLLICYRVLHGFLGLLSFDWVLHGLYRVVDIRMYVEWFYGVAHV